MSSTKITKALHKVIHTTDPKVGFTPKEVISLSMHTSSAMSPLIEHFNTNTIQMVGIWWSDAILLYLNTPTQDFTVGLVERMEQHVDYSIILSSHGVQHLISSGLGILQSYVGVKLVAWYRIGDDLAIKIRLITP